MRRPTIKSLVKDKEISQAEARVLAEIRRNKGISNRALSMLLDMPINVITPTNFSLRAKGFVTQSGYVHDQQTNRTVRSWVSA